MLLLYSVCLLLLALLPTLMVVKNLQDFTRATAEGEGSSGAGNAGAAGEVENGTALAQAISVLIPARNEEAGIAAAVESILSCPSRNIEVIVLDDHSTDRTVEIVQAIAVRDDRVRVVAAPDLPEGWNGKQHACWQLAQIAQHPLMLFMDADVRLHSSALPRMIVEFQKRSVSLLSGFPNQELGTLSEELLIPMMYVVLLSYLPLERMRASPDPRFGAGCGQLFLASRVEYLKCGGHRGIRESRHDGLQLPRLFRASGLATDLFDASDLATVRMYRGVGQVTRGLLKNATEGIARMPLIVIFSILLLGGYTLPLFSLAHALYWGWGLPTMIVLAIATALSCIPRALIAARLKQSFLGVILQPVAVLWFVILQWYAYIHSLLGLRPVAWRGRA